MHTKNTIIPELDKILEGFDSSFNLPGYLRISLLDSCTHNCFFCHNEGAEGEGRQIDEEIMFKVIKASFNLGKKKIRFTGGEPTLHPKLTEYVLKTRKLYPDLNIGITTNGVLLSKMPKEFYDSLDHITVSLHSLNNEVHKQITGKDTLPRILEGLEYVKSVGFKNLKINAVVSDYNRNELEAIADYSLENGFSLRFLDILPSPNHSNESLISPTEIVNVLDGLKETRPDLISYLVAKDKPYHEKCGPCNKKPYCGESEYLRLSAVGELHPCLYRPDLVIGIDKLDSQEDVVKKVALGLRRIRYDNI